MKFCFYTLVEWWPTRTFWRQTVSPTHERGSVADRGSYTKTGLWWPTTGSCRIWKSRTTQVQAIWKESLSRQSIPADLVEFERSWDFNEGTVGIESLLRRRSAWTWFLMHHVLSILPNSYRHWWTLHTSSQAVHSIRVPSSYPIHNTWVVKTHQDSWRKLVWNLMERSAGSCING